MRINSNSLEKTLEEKAIPNAAIIVNSINFKINFKLTLKMLSDYTVLSIDVNYNKFKTMEEAKHLME